jgi:glycosyltransferase involved in cell wall biosynthesis
VGREKGSGFVVPPSDVSALAGAMEEISLLAAARQAEMGANGQERARAKFDLRLALDIWEGIYDEMKL